MAFNMFIYIYAQDVYMHVCICERSGQLKFGNLFLHSYISDTLPIFLSYLVFVWLEGNDIYAYL